jgi:NifU-like protein involved in Fe-S cluster formation
MKRVFALLILCGALFGCGVETASTAATAAALKQKELEAGKKTMSDVQQKMSEATEKLQQDAQKAADADK